MSNKHAGPIREEVSIVGTGRMGTTLASILALPRGFKLDRIASRRLKSARQAVERVRAGSATTSLSRASKAPYLILAVSDDSLEDLSRELARSRRNWQGKCVLHTSGASSPAVLNPLARAGASTACLHFLQTVPDPDLGKQLLRGCVATVEGDDDASHFAMKLARTARARPVRVEISNRPLYHAAAVAASNLVAVLLSAAIKAAVRADLPPSEAITGLAALCRGVTEVAGKKELSEALTGPLVRGDLRTIKEHLAALSSKAPELESVYRSISLLALRTPGIFKGHAAEKRELRDLLERPLVEKAGTREKE